MSVRPINRDLLLLGQKALPATPADLSVAQDLLDTLSAHRADCVGMAANMIGQCKAIIAINPGFGCMAMLNPKILKKSGPYETEEGCLSLPGVRKCTRYQEITVSYQDLQFKPQKQSFRGFTAQIIQHELDHLAGIII